MNELLDPRLMARLERLALRSRRRADGRTAGGHRARRRGESLEFVDHREYVPGDDLRHLDWQLLARLDRLFVKLFEARQDRTMQVVLDRSASMAGAKWGAARKAAAAVSFASLCSLDRVQLFAAEPVPIASGRPARGRSAIHRLLGFLGPAPQAGLTDLAGTLRKLPAAQGGVVTVLVSDLWDPAGVAAAFGRLAGRGEAHVLHVVDPREVDPSHLQGDLTLVDSETGEELAVSVDRPTRERYRAAVEEHFEAVEAAARHRGLGYYRLSATDDLDERLIQWLQAADRALAMGAVAREGARR